MKVLATHSVKFARVNNYFSLQCVEIKPLLIIKVGPSKKTHREIRYRSTITNKSQVKYTPKDGCCSTLRNCKELTSDAISKRNKQKWYTSCGLKEYSSYKHTKWHPQRAYIKIKARIPAAINTSLNRFYVEICNSAILISCNILNRQKICSD